MTWSSPTRSEIGAFIQTLAMPVVALAWGLSSLGCLSWVLALLFILSAGVYLNWMVILCLGWSLFALPLGWWNFGQFLRWFSGDPARPSKLASVAAISAALLATNPLLFGHLF